MDGGFIPFSSLWLLHAWKSHPLLPIKGALTAEHNLTCLNHTSSTCHQDGDLHLKLELVYNLAEMHRSNTWILSVCLASFEFLQKCCHIRISSEVLRYQCD